MDSDCKGMSHCGLDSEFVLNCAFLDFPRENCTEGDIRISEVVVLGDVISGLVEVCQNNEWHKVCFDEFFFDEGPTNVVCRNLGFEPYEGMA